MEEKVLLPFVEACYDGSVPKTILNGLGTPSHLDAKRVNALLSQSSHRVFGEFVISSASSTTFRPSTSPMIPKPDLEKLAMVLIVSPPNFPVNWST